MKLIAFSASIFALAGLAEIGGGWLVWQWLRGSRSLSFGIAGALVLVAYGAIATLQPTSFSRAYAAYGGVFIAMSLAWGWVVDGNRPDRPELLGALLCIAGAALIMFGPRSEPQGVDAERAGQVEPGSATR